MLFFQLFHFEQTMQVTTVPTKLQITIIWLISNNGQPMETRLKQFCIFLMNMRFH